jgi:hypothetical protein
MFENSSMAVFIERRVVSRRMRPRRDRIVLFSRCAKLEGKNIVVVTSRIYDPFRRAVARSVYSEIYNVLLLPPAFASKLTTRVFSRYSHSASSVSLRSTLAFFLFNGYKNCENAQNSAKCVERYESENIIC